MKTISFDAISIAAIRTGEKTMTRRPVKKWGMADGMAVQSWEVGDVAYARTGRFMRRIDSPFSIRITACRIESLQKITAKDVELEGIDVVNHLPLCPDILTIDQLIGMTASHLFEDRWDGIYKKTWYYKWDVNPLVEVLTFEVIP